MDEMDDLSGIIEALTEITADSNVPRNVRAKLIAIKTGLEQGKDLSMVISRSLADLDEISGNTNIQAYTRQQIWNISSLLEMAGH